MLMCRQTWNGGGKGSCSPTLKAGAGGGVDNDHQLWEKVNNLMVVTSQSMKIEKF